MWIFTVIATVSGLGGLALGIRNYWLLRYKPVHERQTQLQTNLKKTLRLVNQHHFRVAVQQLEASQMPSQSGKEQLESLVEMLRPHVNDYIAPTPDQIAAYIATVQAAANEWNNVLQPPGADRIFVDGDADGRARLLARLKQVYDDTNCIVDGITTIEKKPLSARRQQKLFNALEARRPQPALPSQAGME
jgi:hypothetical protein